MFITVSHLHHSQLFSDEHSSLNDNSLRVAVDNVIQAFTIKNSVELDSLLQQARVFISVSHLHTTLKVLGNAGAYRTRASFVAPLLGLQLIQQSTACTIKTLLAVLNSL